MSLGSILKAIGKIGTTAYSILKVAKPILDALRPAIREVDIAMTEIEEVVAKGGVEADDFIDRNRGAIIATKEAAMSLVTIGDKLNLACEALLEAGADDTVDSEEVRAIGYAFKDLHDVIVASIPNIEAATKSLDKVK